MAEDDTIVADKDSLKRAVIYVPAQNNKLKAIIRSNMQNGAHKRKYTTQPMR